MEKKLLNERVIEFSTQVVQLSGRLEQITQHAIARQLIRSATSIGASVFEAQHAESMDDFIHKLKIACKEASETFYWFRIAENLVPIDPALKEELTVIYKMINKSIATSKLNRDLKKKDPRSKIQDLPNIKYL